MGILGDFLMKKVLNSLNPAQREAATHIDGSLLILAGAGSGKTKTLTTRLAYLIGEVGIDPPYIYKQSSKRDEI